jgi:hypothetical protein
MTPKAALTRLLRQSESDRLAHARLLTLLMEAHPNLAADHWHPYPAKARVTVARRGRAISGARSPFPAAK